MNFLILHVPSHPGEKNLDFLSGPSKNSHEQSEREAFQPVQHIDKVPFSNLFHCLFLWPGIDRPLEYLDVYL